MKQLFVMLLLLCSAVANAQDVIVKKDGSTIVCRVVELTSTEITYKKWNDLNGSNYVMNRADASAINYQNGKKVSLSEVTNLYSPNNQNDGVQQYNDNLLLTLDKASNSSTKTAKILKIIGWSGGIALVGTGAVFIALAGGDSGYTTIGGILAGSGVVWTTGFLLAANLHNKSYHKLQTSKIYQYDFKLSNGSSLSAGIDMLSDRTIGNKTLGLGLRYNF